MNVEETLDTGDVFARREIEILETHTSENLTANLAVVGGQLLVETLNEGLGTGVPQHGETTYAAKVSADDLRLDWQLSSIEVLRRVRAVRTRCLTLSESKLSMRNRYRTRCTWMLVSAMGLE
jgi:methionyl-tRNA formyltransferase